MKIVVGLGNPGPKYETTRHNAGFLAVDRLVERWKATGPQNKYQAEVWKAKVGGEDVLLLKPETFMNLSGKSVAPAFNFFQCAPEDLIVIHDELDLKPMQLRLKTGGGPGGHNGIKSIDASLGAGKTGYHRVRIGIGHPSSAVVNQPRIAPVDWVLMQFSQEECERLDKA
ncbi:MAG: aminoacyl-tRNA hydrolase, partial [Bdellovibrionota bacterium]